MSGAPHLSDLASHPNRLIRQLGTRGDLRPGSLVVNHRRCGQSSCCRADKKRRRHGRYWLLTVKGEPRSRSIPAVQVTETKAQITECQRLRRLGAEPMDQWLSATICASPGSSQAAAP